MHGFITGTEFDMNEVENTITYLCHPNSGNGGRIMVIAKSGLGITTQEKLLCSFGPHHRNLISMGVITSYFLKVEYKK